MTSPSPLNPVDQSKLMDGRPLARRLLDDAAALAARIKSETDDRVIPTLATIIVGDDEASHTYVRMKRRRCEEAGMRPVRVELPEGTTTEELLAEIDRLAADDSVHGILLQHPVPAPIDRRTAFERIPVSKDVDGATSAALGRLILGLPAYRPCTPEGIRLLLEDYDVDLDGADAIVIGRSPILGRPMASMLINRHATVTLCHSRTRELPDHVARADILVGAVGKPVLMPALALGTAALLGAGAAEMAVLAVLAVSPSAVAAVPMAAELGGDTHISASGVVLTTLLAPISVVIWLTLLLT